MSEEVIDIRGHLLTNDEDEQNDQNFANPDDFYAILGVNKEDSDEIITRAYRKLALRYQPDAANKVCFI